MKIWYKTQIGKKIKMCFGKKVLAYWSVLFSFLHPDFKQLHNRHQNNEQRKKIAILSVLLGRVY